jgi:hypothetical protein
MDERALLREIAYGADPTLTPRDRLKALELLRGLGPEEPAALDVREELRHLSGRELDAQLDALCGHEIVGSALRGEGRWPCMERAIRQAVETRARALAPELVHELLPSEDA